MKMIDEFSKNADFSLFFKYFLGPSTLGTGHRMDNREPQRCFYRVHWVGVAATTLVLFFPFRILSKTKSELCHIYSKYDR